MPPIDVICRGICLGSRPGPTGNRPGDRRTAWKGIGPPQRRIDHNRASGVVETKNNTVVRALNDRPPNVTNFEVRVPRRIRNHHHALRRTVHRGQAIVSRRIVDCVPVRARDHGQDNQVMCYAVERGVAHGCCTGRTFGGRAAIAAQGTEFVCIGRASRDFEVMRPGPNAVDVVGIRVIDRISGSRMD